MLFEEDRRGEKLESLDTGSGSAGSIAWLRRRVSELQVQFFGDCLIFPRAQESRSPAIPATSCCKDGSGKGELVALASQSAAVTAKAAQNGKKPNILVIWGDDIDYWNLSAYNRGQMGYRTPNIDRIAKEGAIFTDCYAQQSCTAGRAAEHRTKAVQTVTQERKSRC
jgi:hypothetical protein